MAKVDKAFRQKEASSFGSHSREVQDDGEEYSQVGVGGILAATENLLAVNRGLKPPDERDSAQYKKTFRTHQLLADRIRLDAGKLRKSLLHRVAKQRNLKSLHSFYFDPYVEGQILGNALSAPLEEINPMQLVEQSRRTTLMGPGGLGSDQAITEATQCHSEDTSVYTKEGWKLWPDVTTEDLLACRVNGVLEFHRAESLHKSFYRGPMYGVKSISVNFLLSPDHRLFTSSSARTENWHWETAEYHHGKYRFYIATAEPYAGTDGSETFTLPQVERHPNGRGLKDIPPIEMGDWCEFMGWYLSEGSCYNGVKDNKYSVTLSQCEIANPDKVSTIRDLCRRLPFHFNRKGVNFRTKSKVLFSYVEQFGKALDKFLPDFLFEVRPEFRRRFLKSFLAGDGSSQNGRSKLYSSSSRRMVDGIERLLISCGASTSLRKPFKVYNRKGEHSSWIHAVRESCVTVKETKPQNHFKEHYEGHIYCATVPGGMLLTRRAGMGFWSGNSLHPSTFGFLSVLEGPESNRIGVDTRVAWGAKLGSDGRMYQKFKDRRTGRYKWMSPQSLDGLTIKLPD